MNRPLDDVTVLIPFDRVDGNRNWLTQALDSFPKGTKYLVLENEHEPAEAWNEGVKLADTEFVQFFGSDDVALPGFLKSLRALASDVDVVYPAAILVDETLSECLAFHRAMPFSIDRLFAPWIYGASLARRSKVLEVGGFDPALPKCLDWDLWVRMGRAGARFKACSTATMLYRQHSGQISETRVDRRALIDRIMNRPGSPRLAPAYSLPSTVSVHRGRCGYPAKRRKNR